MLALTTRSSRPSPFQSINRGVLKAIAGNAPFLGKGTE